MRTNFRHMLFLGSACLGLLMACSGGSYKVKVEGPDINSLPTTWTSEDITSYGPITGLNELTVNDVRYTAIGANVIINDQPALLSDLRRGQVVTVIGRRNIGGLSGTAGSIVFDANVIGAVASLDAANGRMIVMGQTVMTGPDTHFASGIDPATYAGLAVGDTVQVSGFADADGRIRATRIDPANATGELQLIGRVSAHDAANLLFRVDRLTVDYSGAWIISLPGGMPANGMMVKVIGSYADGRFLVDQLLAAPRLAGSSGERVHVAGLVTRFRSSSDFDINGFAAAADSRTSYRDGGRNDLGLNAEIIVDGEFAANGRIVADRISFSDLAHRTETLSFAYSNFNEIAVSTVFNVTVEQGPDFLVEVTVDQEVADRVNVSQTGATLNIALQSGDGSIQTRDALVRMPVLDRIELDGVTNVSLRGFTQPRMVADVGGVSRLHGENLSLQELSATVSGVSMLDFADTRPLGTADIAVSGVSQATVNMDFGATLSGSVSTGTGTGFSTLFYYGTNVDVNVAADRLSTVVKLGETRP